MEELKWSLFAGGMILFIENPEDSTKKNSVRINQWLSKVLGYKLSIQMSVALMYTSSELLEGKIKKLILFTIALKY